MLRETEWKVIPRPAPSLHSSAAPTSDADSSAPQIGHHTAFLGPGTGLVASNDTSQPTVETPPGSALNSCQSAPAAAASDRNPASAASSAATPFSAPSAIQSGPYQTTLIQKSPLGSGCSNRGAPAAAAALLSASLTLEEQAARAEALIQMKLEEVRQLRAQFVQMFQEQTLGARRGAENESSAASHGHQQYQGNESPGGGLRASGYYQGTSAERRGSESGRAGSSGLNPASASHAQARGPRSRASLGSPASYRQASPPRRTGHHSRANSRDSRQLQTTSSLFRSALTNHSARVSLQGQLQPGSGGSDGSVSRTLVEGGAGLGSAGAGAETSPPGPVYDTYITTAAMTAAAGAGYPPRSYQDVDFTQDPTFRFTGGGSGGSGAGPAAGLPGSGASSAAAEAQSAGPGPHSGPTNKRSIQHGFMGVGTVAGPIAAPQSPQDAQMSSPTTPAARRLRSVATSIASAAGGSQKAPENSKHKNRVHPGPHPVHNTNKGLLGSPMAAPGRPRPLVSVDGPGSSAGPSLQHESAQDGPGHGFFGRMSRWIQTTLGFGGFGLGSLKRRDPDGRARTEGPQRAPHRVLTVVPFPGPPSRSRRAHPTC